MRCLREIFIPMPKLPALAAFILSEDQEFRAPAPPPGTRAEQTSSSTSHTLHTNHHKPPPTQTANMSMFGLGRPQPSSAEKIAAAEQEMDMVTDMFNKYFSLPFSLFTTPKPLSGFLPIKVRTAHLQTPGCNKPA